MRFLVTHRSEKLSGDVTSEYTKDLQGFDDSVFQGFGDLLGCLLG